MKRGQFLKRLGFGTVAAVVAPTVLIEALKPEDAVVKEIDNLIPTGKGHFVKDGRTTENYISSYDYASQYCPETEKLLQRFNDRVELQLMLGEGSL